MSFRIEIETDDCMSSGKCVADYPGVFFLMTRSWLLWFRTQDLLMKKLSK